MSNAKFTQFNMQFHLTSEFACFRYLTAGQPITVNVNSGNYQNLIKAVLPKLINNDHAGFMRGRFIGENIRLIDGIIQHAAYTLFQNGRHLNILLFLFKLALDASFLSLKFKRIFYLERGNKG